MSSDYLVAFPGLGIDPFPIIASLFLFWVYQSIGMG